MSNRRFDYGFAGPHLEQVRVLLEARGFTYSGPNAKGAARGKYLFRYPARRSFYVYAPVTPAGNPRVMTPDAPSLWTWRVGSTRRYARTAVELVDQVCAHIDEDPLTPTSTPEPVSA